MIQTPRRLVGVIAALVGLSTLVAAQPAVALSYPVYTVNPTTLDFGQVAVNSTKTINVVITNTGSAAGTPNYTGGAPFDAVNWTGTQNCGGVTLAIGASCQFSYVFQPKSAGTHNSSTSIGIDNTNYTITLLGVGGSTATTTTTTATTTRPTTPTRASSGGATGGGATGGGAASGATTTSTAPAGLLGATVLHSEVTTGDDQSATARGFEPKEVVSAVLQPDGVDLGSRVADADSVVRFTWKVDERPGSYKFVATGSKSGQVSASFTVAAEDSGTGPWLIAGLAVLAVLVVAGLVVFAYRRGRRQSPTDTPAP